MLLLKTVDIPPLRNIKLVTSPIPIKHYLLIVIDFFSKLKVSCGLSNNNHSIVNY